MVGRGLAILAFVGAMGCSADSNTGEIGGHCYANGTCNGGLSCLAGICGPADAGVDAPDAPPDAPPDANGAASFDSMITPLVTECIVSGCHDTLQAPVLTSFDALGSRYKTKPGASNILVTKGGNPPPGTHAGIPYLTAIEQSTVAAWIDSL